MVAGGVGERLTMLLGDLDLVAVAEVLTGERRSSSRPLIVRCAIRQHGNRASMSPAASRARQLRMPHARPPHRLRPGSTPDKLAVIDDRAGPEVRRHLRRARRRPNRLAHGPRRLGVEPGVKGRVVRAELDRRRHLVNAARKIGATAVPLNYRLSDEEAAYVTDHSDAVVVYVDAELAPLFAASARRSRRSRTSSCSTAPVRMPGMESGTS